MKKQSGFTLVEIAIVMVIIGLLLGGALKGQEMIQSAKIKRVKADFDQFVAAFYSYQDLYRALPGDNIKAEDQHSAPKKGDGDGTIEKQWNSTTANEESRLFWEHLRTAGLISGSGQAQPANSFSGIVGVQNAIASFSGLAFCFSSIDGDVGASVDTQYDDGNAQTGTIRGIKSDGALASSYTNSNYSKAICIEI